MNNEFEKKFHKTLLDSKKDPGIFFFFIMNNNSIISEFLIANKTRIDKFTYNVISSYISLLNNDLIKCGYYLELIEDKTCPYYQILYAMFLSHTKNTEYAFKLYIDLYNSYKHSFFIVKNIFDLCFECGWYDRGIYFYNEIKKQNYNYSLYLDYKILDYGATFYHLNMEFNKAIDLQKEKIELFLQNSMDELIKKDTNVLNTIVFDTKQAWDSLVDILSLFEENNIKAFPTAGTLLGLYREKDLLSFDKDIDIAISYDSDLELVKYLIDKNPRYEIPKNNPFTSYITFLDKKTNCAIDILKFYKFDDSTFHYGWFLTGNMESENRVLIFDYFNLIKKEYNGHIFNIPENTDHFLTQLYGNWRVPDVNYFSVLCNNIVKRTNLTDSMSYNFICKYLISGKFEKILAIINALRKHDYNDITLDKLEKYLLKKING